MIERRFYEEHSLRADSSTNANSSARRKLYEENETEKVLRGEFSTSRQLYEWGQLYDQKALRGEDDREKVLRGESSASRQLYEGRQLYEETAPRGEMAESAGDPSRANIDTP